MKTFYTTEGDQSQRDESGGNLCENGDKSVVNYRGAMTLWGSVARLI